MKNLRTAVLGALLVTAGTLASPLPAMAAPQPDTATRTFLLPDESLLGHEHEHEHEHEHAAPTQVTLPVASGARSLKASGPVVRKVKVVMLVPAGVRQDANPMTEAQVRAGVASASQFWSDQTAGQVRFEVSSVKNWSPTRLGCEDTGALWEEVAGTGLKPGPNETLLTLLPTNGFKDGQCGYGLATIGDSLSSPGYVAVTGTSTALISHELGHNIGSGHANSVSCMAAGSVADPSSADPWSCANGPARYDAYGDGIDVMGPSGDTSGSLNSVLADQLGLAPTGFLDVTGGGTFDLASLPVVGDGRVHALRVRDPFSGVTYYVEHRGASAYDKKVGAMGTTLGVRVLRADAPGSRASVAVDATPGADADGSLVLTPGSTFSTASNQVHVTTVSSSTEGASVKVTMGTRPVQFVTPSPAPTPPSNNSTRFYGPNGEVELYGPILERYRALGMFSSVLQAPSTRTTTLAAGGAYAHFQGGSIYYSPATGAQVVRGAIRDRWAALGWENGLGYPTGDEFSVKGGQVQRFQRGLVYWSQSTGAREVKGSIMGTFGALGWEGGLGFPTTGEVALRNGAFNHFQGGSVYWSPATGAHAIRGAFLDKWSRAGWENGPLGFPLTSEFGALRGGGAGQHFQGGSMYWSQPTGATMVRGALRDAYASQGWEAGNLGYPRGDDYGVPGGVRQDFQGGSLVYSWSTRTVTRG